MCVRQGSLLSMLLYTFAAEILVNLINADKRIKGIEIGDHEIKIVNFTGNTTIFLRDGGILPAIPPSSEEIWSNGLVVKVQDSQYRILVFKTSG